MPFPVAAAAALLAAVAVSPFPAPVTSGPPAGLVPAGDVVRVHTGTPGATVLANVTVTAPTHPGHVRAYPCVPQPAVGPGPDGRPNSSVLNFAAGETAAAFTPVAADSAGDICVYTSAAANLIVDVSASVPSAKQAPSTRSEAVGRAVYLALRDAGATPAGAAGVVASLDRVSSLDPNVYAGQTPFAQTNARPAPGAVPGIGMAQIVTTVRQERMLADAEASGRAWDDPYAQADTIVAELKESFPELWTLLATTSDANGAAFNFFHGYQEFGGPAAPESAAPAAGQVQAAGRSGADWLAWLDTQGSASAMPAGTPVRMLDTRNSGVKAAAGATVTFPATAGKVSYGTLTVVAPAAGGHALVWDCAQPKPVASTVNFTEGKTIANMFAATASGSGQLCVYTSAQAHLVVDVAGAGSGLTAGAPTRMLDTRQTFRPAGSSVTKVQTGVKGRTVLANVAAVDPLGGGHVVAYPCDAPRPATSSLNYTTGTNRANFTAVRTAADGTVCLYTPTATHLLFDLVGQSDKVLATRSARLVDTRTAAPAAVTALGLAPQGYDRITGGKAQQIGLGTHSAIVVESPVYGTSVRFLSRSGEQDDWQVDLATPDGADLREGTSFAARRWAGSGFGRLSVTASGRACNASEGYVWVHEFVRDAAGAVKRLDASFVQMCDNGAPVEGRAQFNSSYR